MSDDFLFVASCTVCPRKRKHRVDSHLVFFLTAGYDKQEHLTFPHYRSQKILSTDGTCLLKNGKRKRMYKILNVWNLS